MNGFYLCTEEEGYFDNPHGVAKKILSQIKTFEKAGLNTTLYPFHFLPNTKVRKALRRVPFCSVACNFPFQPQFQNADFFYIRTPRGEYSFVQLLKKLRAYNPKAKILLELATYPYDSENAGRMVDIPFVLKDRVNRNKYKKYADCMITFGQFDRIFGLPVISTVNGVMVDDIRPVQPSAKALSQDTVNVIAVAMLAAWHGYDRFLRGLGAYYKNGGTRNIVLHLVGISTDDTLANLKQLAKAQNIEEHVIFYGAKTGAELDAIYDDCAIGLECLGTFRQGTTRSSSSLKSREYWSKGLPLVTACTFTQNTDEISGYIHTVPFDDTPVDIPAFLQFYDTVYASDNTHENAITTLRNYAYKTCDMSVTMKPVTDYISGKATLEDVTK
ncbi:MAG: glycosyltransferase [Oscillospiraceae bacterium]|nr:glycosyltransferase [Oscillospiraceae bacterium]